jgi:uncharacterized protein DUF3105
MRFPRRLVRGSLASVLAGSLSLSACGGGDIQVSGSARTIPGLTAEEQQLFDQAQAAMDSAACTAVETVSPYDPAELDRSHIGGSDLPLPPPLSSYASRPPASGPHDPIPLASGVYREPPPVYRTIHSLEHAAVIVWVQPKVLDSDPQTPEFGRLAAFFSRPDEIDHVIVAPYDYPDQGPAGALPPETSMALISWHRRQLCRDVSLPVAFAFVSDYRFDPVTPSRYLGEAPEPGVPIG